MKATKRTARAISREIAYSTLRAGVPLPSDIETSIQETLERWMRRIAKSYRKEK
jgi:hypothetical protein